MLVDQFDLYWIVFLGEDLRAENLVLYLLYFAPMVGNGFIIMRLNHGLDGGLTVVHRAVVIDHDSIPVIPEGARHPSGMRFFFQVNGNEWPGWL